MGQADGPIVGLIEAYLKTRSDRGEFLPKTVRKQRVMLMDFARSFGRRPVARLGPGDIERWHATMVKRALLASTRYTRLSAVRAFSRWLIERRVITRDPMAGAPKIRKERPSPRTFTAEEVATLLAYAPNARGRLIVLLIFRMGLRCGEVAGLRMEDVIGLTLRVKGKGGHERELPIAPQVARAMEEYLRLERRGAWQGALIQNERNPGRGIQPGSVSTLLYKWISGAGLKRYPFDGRSAHGGRRTFATTALDEGAPIEEVAGMLGHADLDTVQYYAKVRPSRFRRWMEDEWFTPDALVDALVDAG